jgi:hypothetical protein
MTLLREWLGIPHTPDAEKRIVEETLRDQKRRLARIDAGLPRRHQTFPHPHRRASDARH